MIVIPAIDLKGGKVVRLVKGDFSQEIVYGDDPVSVAKKFIDDGAQRVHVVDLDGALTGVPSNTEKIVQVAKAIAPVPVQTGGGIRTIETMRKYIDAGLHSVIVGSKACSEESFITKAVKEFNDRVIVSIDAKQDKDGSLRVTTGGWVQSEYMKPEALLARLMAQGVRTFVYTDISRDGTMAGPAVEGHRTMLKAVGGRAQYIASGGVGSLEDLLKLKPLEAEGLTGVIVGRAIYEAKLDLRKAIEACSPKGSSPASTSKTAGSSKESGS